MSASASCACLSPPSLSPGWHSCSDSGQRPPSRTGSLSSESSRRSHLPWPGCPRRSDWSQRASLAQTAQPCPCRSCFHSCPALSYRRTQCLPECAGSPRTSRSPRWWTASARCSPGRRSATPLTWLWPGALGSRWSRTSGPRPRSAEVVRRREPQPMITIGQLAAYAGVTIKAVRHYHKRGLLEEPSRDSSGYRRYTAQHAIDLVKIKTLAEAGVPLVRVKELLAA